MSRLNVIVQPMTQDDLPRGAEIYLDAFETDNIMTTLRPAWLHNSSYSREKRIRLFARNLRKFQFESEKKICMKAMAPSPDGREIMYGMAIWVKPGVPVTAPSREELEEPEEAEQDEETDVDGVYRLAVELVRSRTDLYGDLKHWYLAYLVVDPAAHGKGVGGALIDWGCQQADTSSPPLPIIVESSVHGRPVYIKKGFEIKGWLEVERRDKDGNVEEMVQFPSMFRTARIV